MAELGAGVMRRFPQVRSCPVGLILAVCIVSALLLASAGRSASTLCVGGPHCYATVQAALNAAQDGDTVRVGPGTFPGGVTITKSINLVGVAAAASSISGGGPVVTIGSPTSAPTVTFANLTITGGVTTGNPQAPNCGPDVPSCGPGYADATALGGGIEAFQGTTVTISRSVVTGNRAIPALTTQSVKAVCPGPAPCPASFGDAAGIDNWGTMTIVDSTVSDNYAAAVQSDGGGIVSERGTSLTVLNSRVTGNSANAVGPWGRFVQAGGILADHDVTLTIENSNIDGNAANLTSSIPHPYPLQGGPDQSNAFSGGIHMNDGVVASIRNSTLNGNSVNVSNPVGEPFGADAAMCSCGSATLTLENAQVRDNSVNVNVVTTADSGPSGAGALEVDSDAAIRNVQFTGNSTNVTAANGDAGALGALLFLFGGENPPTIADSSISDNVATVTAPHGAATIQGVGLTNNGPLTLTNVDVERNHGVATGLSGYARGGGIWNGELFGGPESPLTLVGSQVKNNVLEGSPGVSLQGGGIFTAGFPLTLTNSMVKHNAPEDCFGC
jgi:hypothetical protein